MKSAPSFRFGVEGVEWWVAHNIPGCGRGFGPCYTLGVFNPELVAGVVFHNHNPESGVLEMSAAATGPWMTRSIVCAAHSFIFDQMECQLSVMRVSEGNRRMCRIAGALGYHGTTIPRLRGRHEAEVIFTLTDDDWRLGKWSKING